MTKTLLISYLYLYDLLNKKFLPLIYSVQREKNVIKSSDIGIKNLQINSENVFTIA